MRIFRPPTDKLLLRAAGGDREAFRALYADLYDPVARFVGRRVRHREDAEDVVSRTFERLLLRLESYDERRGGGPPLAPGDPRDGGGGGLRAEKAGGAP